MKRLIPLLLTLFPLAAGAFPEQAGNAAFWKAMDWDHPATTPVWQDRNWVNYIGVPAPGETRQRIQDVRLADVDLLAILARSGTSSRQPDQLQLLTQAADRRRDQCPALTRWAKSRFGAPAATSDAGYTLNAESGKGMVQSDLSYQWDIGTTRLTLLCQTREIPTQPGKPLVESFSRLTFGSLAATPELKPLVSASCTRNEHAAGASEPGKSLDRMGFVIDENKRLIRRPDKVPLKASDVRIDRDSVSFSLERDTASNDYRLDRNTGLLTGTLRLAGIPMIRISGHCQLKPLTGAASP
ncbi:hypothetical protein [Paludibacterium paludis]|uniref:Uncharacterized protein n=1 Tax=Paludibacterium paludis TaxID=1225769 RepID=A0A918P3K8_9NEIS|nr:hypothetical protein [Paludibacterium paludis]GGY17202.1 hypothetical protein GCM10011289_20710 [Paludibacterium paludis]